MALSIPWRPTSSGLPIQIQPAVGQPTGVRENDSGLGDGPTRLAQAAALVPQFSPWVSWINWMAPRLLHDLCELEELEMPVDDPERMHLVLRSLLGTYLLESGVVSEAEDDIVAPIF